MTRSSRIAFHLLLLAGAFAAAAAITDVAQARGATPFGAGVNVDLNIASLIVATSTALAGALGYLRLRSERPKIVAEVGKINEERDALLEERLRTALRAAWDDVDRCNAEIGKLRSREAELQAHGDELERRVDELERRLRDAGVELP